MFDDYLKYVKGATRHPASNYWDLELNIATFMAFVWVFFGDRCDYYWNLYKIYTVMDTQEVQQLKGKFTPEICRQITWAILIDGWAFFNMVLTPQDFESGLLVFPQSFLSSILDLVQFCNPIQWENFLSDWLQQPKGDCTRQGRSQAQAQGTPGDVPGTSRHWGGGMTGGRGRGNGTGGGGCGQSGGRGGGLGSPVKREAYGGGGGMQDGGYPWGARYQWSPPTNNPRHPKIDALMLMNPYLNHFNGLHALPELLKTGNVCYEDLPVLNRFRNPTTGKSTVCWAHVLGPCHYQDCYFAARGSHLIHDD
jgi:hypothetical protein